jgi:head-tail adaptor
VEEAMIPRSRILIPLCALALAVGAAVAGAQTVASDRVQLALDLTDHRIEQAQSVLAGATNPRAQLELDAAVNMQGLAKAAFNASQWLRAMDLTLGARGHADRAIAIIRGLPDPDQVRTQLERTRELLDRARERIEDCDNPRARAMLRIAFEMQARAEGAAQELRFLGALQLTMSARERAMKALRLCNLEENLRESAERALRRTDEIIARAQDIVSERGTDQARDALSRSMQIQERAHAEFRAEHFEASLRMTQASRTFAYRAIRLSGGVL